MAVADRRRPSSRRVPARCGRRGRGRRATRPCAGLMAARIRRVSARMAPIVNSATALALRPGVLTTRIAVLARRRHVDIDRPAARDGDQLEVRQPIHHAGGERRELRDQRSRRRRRRRRSRRGRPYTPSGRPARFGIAVLHRLVRPGQFQRADVDRPLAAGLRDLAARTSGSMKRSPMIAICPFMPVSPVGPRP